MTRKTANRAMKTAINGVVPHPGATFPYSEFRGFNKVPRLVTTLLLIVSWLSFIGVFEVAINKKEKNYWRKKTSILMFFKRIT
jgi:hypothetical protein